MSDSDTGPESSSETARIREVYSGRVAHMTEAGAYSLANPAHLFAIQGRQRAILRGVRAER